MSLERYNKKLKRLLKKKDKYQNKLGIVLSELTSLKSELSIMRQYIEDITKIRQKQDTRVIYISKFGIDKGSKYVNIKDKKQKIKINWVDSDKEVGYTHIGKYPYRGLSGVKNVSEILDKSIWKRVKND